MAYGDRGVPGVIPPAAMLTAEITILGTALARATVCNGISVRRLAAPCLWTPPDCVGSSESRPKSGRASRRNHEPIMRAPVKLFPNEGHR